MTAYITLAEVIDLQSSLIQKYGGLPGIRSKDLLESALFAPRTTLFDQEMYPTIYDKAAAYLFHLICNHPFNDANKRTAYAVTLVFLDTNNATIKFKDDDFVNLILEIAKGNSNDAASLKEDISSFLQTGMCKTLSRGFR